MTAKSTSIPQVKKQQQYSVSKSPNGYRQTSPRHHFSSGPNPLNKNIQRYEWVPKRGSVGGFSRPPGVTGGSLLPFPLQKIHLRGGFLYPP
ncbi:hypothetical protein JTE90_001094 [Oedothorax gibbosus]|uniref:Uncharacterized protein n=1 Tax=Oedothorax gibbosus TaxID=931172 RepID=A0AAV6UJE5_9ARAC|nr:hypothetical protein JTE90_001094 [Oedothorax gibbosus]